MMNTILLPSLLAFLSTQAAIAQTLAQPSPRPRAKCKFERVQVLLDSIDYFGRCGDERPDVSYSLKDTELGKKAILAINFDQGFHITRSKSQTMSSKICEIAIPFRYQRGCQFAPAQLKLAGSASIFRAHYGDVELHFGEDGTNKIRRYSTPRIVEGTGDFSLEATLKKTDEPYWTPCSGKVTLLYTVKLELYSYPGESSGNYESYLGVGSTSNKFRNDVFWQMREC